MTAAAGARAIVAALALGFACTAQAAAPLLTPTPFVSGLSSPVEIAHAGDSSGRLFVVEQGGRIRVVRNGVLLTTPFLDISPANGGPVRAGGEQGLLGLAFAPDYAASGRFYVFYNRERIGDPGGSDIVVARYNRSAGNADLADPASAQVVIVVAHPQQGNHNGGKLAFGHDGFLYIGIGDGGGGGDPFNAGQDLADLRGKILRLDVSGASGYAIPPSNPFVGHATARAEIWAYGLRNPWKFSFDRANGDLYIGDVGQNAWEEIDYQPSAAVGGRNYGWRVFEGTHCFNPSSGCALAGHVPPVVEYPHNSSGGFSVTGGYLYRGRALPALSGYYIYGDYVTGHIWAARAEESWAPTKILDVNALSTFGEDENGELYAANLDAGTIVRLTPAATTIPRLGGISTRMRVLTGDAVLIGGFIIADAPKRVAIKARGPSLGAQGVADTLADPKLELYSGTTVIASNDDWQDAANAAEVQAAGHAPGNASEAVILTTLPPGPYTAIVSGADGGTGIGIVEVYELDHPEALLVGISTRGRVLTGDGVLIGGFVIDGAAPQKVIIRARGPSLTAQGVPDALQNPALQLFRSTTQIAINDDWQDATNAAEIQGSGFAPSDARESAILVTLDPGAYTAIMSSGGRPSGVGMVEVYRQ